MSNFVFKDYRQPSTDFMLSLRFADGCAVSRLRPIRNSVIP